jgi:hypothetical protein
MESVTDAELTGFLSRVLNVFESLDIPYMVVGGFAAIFYGEPRLTVDVDVVADIQPVHVPAFLAAFSHPDYYLSAETVVEAVRLRRLFGVIHSHTGAKVDVIPLTADPFTQAAFARRQRLPYDRSGRTAWLISLEDIVVAKLRAWRQTGSEKHLRDARSILLLQWGTVDLDAARRSAKALGLAPILEDLLRSCADRATL